jgi:hypothetical protein
MEWVTVKMWDIKKNQYIFACYCINSTQVLNEVRLRGRFERKTTCLCTGFNWKVGRNFGHEYQIPK